MHGSTVKSVVEKQRGGRQDAEFNKFYILNQKEAYRHERAGTAMLINKAPHPNAAGVFINWVLTKDGQTAWSKSRNQLSRRLDVPTDHLPPYIIPRTGGK